MVNETSPRARRDFATKASDRLLSEVEKVTRGLLGNTRGQAAAAAAGAESASEDASAAQDAADAAQLTADGKLSLPILSTIATDADATFTASDSNSVVFHTGTLTGDRAITLAAGTDQWQARFVRTGSGAFNLSIGGLKSLTTGTWCDVHYNGAAWVLTAYGTL